MAAFTVTMNRLDYTKRTFDSLASSTRVPIDHYVIDNGSTDGTIDYLKQNAGRFAGITLNDSNLGLDLATNQALDLIGDSYDYIIKIDNDCEFVDEGWLESLLDVAQACEGEIVLSPRVEGLGPPHLDGGHPRSDYIECAGHLIALSNHVGGLCLLAPSSAYEGFRYRRNPMHGNQDVLFSVHARVDLGYQMGYVEDIRVLHMDTTEGQRARYPEYFELRKVQKRQVYGESPVVTALLQPVRRFRFLRQLDRAGLLEGGVARYLAARAVGRLRPGEPSCEGGCEQHASDAEKSRRTAPNRAEGSSAVGREGT